VHSPLAVETPVLIGSSEDTPEGCEVLLNLSAECPPHFERFARLLEVVDDADREAGRNRYRFYRERGYKLVNHDLAQADE
jgi:DNA polymerase-3 subunit chi